jgi:branched-chain amino acid transport system substrate-binding protein
MAVAAVSCSAGSGPSATRSQQAPDDRLLGPARPATAATVDVGFITDGQSAAADGRPEIAAAQAAVKYVNGYLGGLAGHALRLRVCETHGTPGGAQDCASQMVAAKVPVVLQSAPGQPGPIVKTLAAAGITYLTYATADPQVLLSPSSFVLSNTLGGLAAPVHLAAESHIKRVAELIIDVPAAVGPIESLGGPLFKAAGITVDFITVPPGTPDMTPQVQSGLARQDELFTIIGDPTFCASALRALNTLGFKGTKLVNSQCLSSDLAKKVPGGVGGVKVGTTESYDASDHEVGLYEAVLKRFAPGTAPHQSATSGGYAVVIGLARAMGAHVGDVTKVSVPAALIAAAPQPMPLLAGQTFQCNRKVFTLTPAVCSTGMAIATLSPDGQPQEAVPFDSSAILKGH